jgi:hypothetical protein
MAVQTLDPQTATQSTGELLVAASLLHATALTGLALAVDY